MTDDRSLRFAYADPPYIGCAKLYKKEASYVGEVDHKALLERLNTYDGWALSCSSPSLGYLLSIAPKGVRVGAWVKPFAVFKPNVNPAYAWEPVLFFGVRKRDRKAPTVRDWVSANITLKKGLTGSKPPTFAEWIVNLLGARPGDTIDDLYPGTGICGETFARLLAS